MYETGYSIWNQISKLIYRRIKVDTLTTKWILCYIKDIITRGQLYSFSNNFWLIDYSNSDCGGISKDQKIITNFIFYMGDTVFTSNSKQQSIMVLSTYEEEYITVSLCVCHII